MDGCIGHSVDTVYCIRNCIWCYYLLVWCFTSKFGIKLSFDVPIGITNTQIILIALITALCNYFCCIRVLMEGLKDYLN